MKKKKTFHVQLSFVKEVKNDEIVKVASFVDIRGNASKVITTWDRVIPGLRYDCTLEVNDKNSEESEYKMTYCRVWIDDLMIVNGESAVNVIHNNTVVEDLTFGPEGSTDVDKKVADLKKYFIQKIFQLSCREDIDKFIQAYKDKCTNVYKNLVKSVNKNVKLQGKKICL